jgi:hypothetical protein
MGPSLSKRDTSYFEVDPDSHHTVPLAKRGEDIRICVFDVNPASPVGVNEGAYVKATLSNGSDPLQGNGDRMPNNTCQNFALVDALEVADDHPGPRPTGNQGYSLILFEGFTPATNRGKQATRETTKFFARLLIVFVVLERDYVAKARSDPAS